MNSFFILIILIASLCLLVARRPGGLWNLLLLAGFVLTATTCLSYLGKWNWFADLFTHFRIQYGIGLGLLGVLMSVGRRWRTAILFGLCSLINLIWILPLYVGGPDQTHPNGTIVRVMLSNVNSSSGNPERVLTEIRSQNPDVLVLEEVTEQWLRALAPVLNDYSNMCFEARDDNFGIALYSRLPMTNAAVIYPGASGVPSIRADIGMGETNVTLFATHPPPPAGGRYAQWRNGQFEDLAFHVRVAHRPVILIGDLNATPWNPHFMRLLKESGLKDSAQGRGLQPSWPTFNPLFRIPIDHCLHSLGLKVTARTIGNPVGSDHFPLIVDFVFPK